MAYSPLKRSRSQLDDGGDDTRTSYTSEFLESVADLPIELKKSFSLIKDLDEYMHEMVDGTPSTDQLGLEDMKKKILSKVPARAQTPAPESTCTPICHAVSSFIFRPGRWAGDERGGRHCVGPLRRGGYGGSQSQVWPSADPPRPRRPSGSTRWTRAGWRTCGSSGSSSSSSSRRCGRVAPTGVHPLPGLFFIGERPPQRAGWLGAETGAARSRRCKRLRQKRSSWPSRPSGTSPST